MKWIVTFNDGGSKIAIASCIDIVVRQLVDMDYPIENVIAITMIPDH